MAWPLSVLSSNGVAAPSVLYQVSQWLYQISAKVQRKSYVYMFTMTFVFTEKEKEKEKSAQKERENKHLMDLMHSTGEDNIW